MWGLRFKGKELYRVDADELGFDGRLEDCAHLRVRVGVSLHGG